MISNNFKIDDLFNDLNNQKHHFEETKTNNVVWKRLEYQRKHQSQELRPMKYEKEINKLNNEFIQKNNQELSFSLSNANNSRSTEFNYIDLNLSEILTKSISSVEKREHDSG